MKAFLKPQGSPRAIQQAYRKSNARITTRRCSQGILPMSSSRPLGCKHYRQKDVEGIRHPRTADQDRRRDRPGGPGARGLAHRSSLHTAVGEEDRTVVYRGLIPIHHHPDNQGPQPYILYRISFSTGQPGVQKNKLAPGSSVHLQHCTKEIHTSPDCHHLDFYHAWIHLKIFKV